MNGLNCVAAFYTPLHGTKDGQPVTILATGDMEGSSPVFLIVDLNGNAVWQPIRDVILTEFARERQRTT